VNAKDEIRFSFTQGNRVHTVIDRTPRENKGILGTVFLLKGPAINTTLEIGILPPLLDIVRAI